MFWKTTSIMTAIACTFLAVTTVNVSAACPEGVLHRVIRTVFQVPVAVLRSFEGSTCGAEKQDYQVRVRYPEIRSVYGPRYRLNSEEVYEPLPAPPRYVTYKVVPAPQNPQRPDSEANRHVYSSIPFSDR